MISVIIPVYNAEKYIVKCVESLENQIYKNYELIIVNDGSSDQSMLLINRLKSKYNNIIVVDKVNGGVSSARNVGLDIAHGDYIVFVDSDDWVSEKYLNVLYNNIVNTNSDISMCNVTMINENQKVYNEKFINHDYLELDKEGFIANIQNQFMYFTYATNKLIKKSIIKSIRFREDIFYNEDGLFFLELSNNIRKAVYDGREELYYYYQNTTSANGNFFNDRFLTIIESYKIAEKYFDKYDYQNKCYFSYRYLNYYADVYYYLKLKGKIKKSFRDRYNSIIHKYYKYAKSSNYLSIIDIFKLRIKIKHPYLYTMIKNKLKG